MRKLGAAEVKRQFMSLLRAAERGEQIQMTRKGKVIALLLPPSTPREEKERRKTAGELFSVARRRTLTGARPLRSLRMRED
jgi:antitoxin (DNA-binding transcriptional repressor) of toxin-antitoxin stability system